MKRLEKIIGQAPAKAALNDLIAKIKFMEEREEYYPIPCILLTGETGAGKSFIAKEFAKSLGFQYIPFPTKAGFRFWDTVAGKACSLDEETGNAYAIPTIFHVDECHNQPTLEDMFKLATENDKPTMITRNGTEFFSDRSKHVWIFSSNEKIDPAIRSRCKTFTLDMLPLNRGEKKQVITLYCDKPIDGDALDYLEGRCKPWAREVKCVADRSSVELVERITLETAREIIQKMGLNPLGLVKKDLAILKRISEGNADLNVLKSISGDVQTSETRGRLGWLCSLQLAEPRKSNFILTKAGAKYLGDLMAAQRAEKAANKA